MKLAYLGKTFTALAVIKYYELRNDRVLVIAPKKLRENWEESFIKAGSLTDHSAILPTISNNFDDEEWTW